MPTLVLLPGLDGTGRLFAGLIAACGTSTEIIVVSYPPDRPLDYAGLEPFVRALLPLDRPFFLLAESFSGPLGINLAASAPPGLRGLILCCSFARNPVPMPALLRPAIARLPLHRVPLAALGFFLLGRFASRQLRQALAESLARISPEVLRARARAVLCCDVSGALPGIRVPILYLRASDDRVVPASASELLASLSPRVRIVDFPAPHFLLQVRPGEAARVVMEFMAGSAISG